MHNTWYYTPSDPKCAGVLHRKAGARWRSRPKSSCSGPAGFEEQSSRDQASGFLDGFSAVFVVFPGCSSKEMKICGCVALVTGGASGIGRGICEVLLQRDAKVK